jgi:hypothetical protein
MKERFLVVMVVCHLQSDRNSVVIHLLPPEIAEQNYFF